MRAFLSIGVIGLLSGVVVGQAFDLADVSAKALTPSMRGPVLRGGTAYGIDADKVLSGPGWLEPDRFDVIAGPPPPSGSNGAVFFEDALNKQLGIKLEMQKRPMPVLVIDHVEEKPTDN